jgi:spore maturation protein CgeB
MKILLAGVEQVKKDERYMDDKGWSFRKAFEKLGADVEPFFYKKKGRLSFVEKSKHIKTHWRAHMNRELQRLVTSRKPDILILLKCETIEAETLLKIRKKTDTTIVNVFPDNPLYMGNVEAIEPCHMYFVKDSYIVSTLRKAGYGNAYYLPQCTDPDVHMPLELGDEDRAKYGAEVSLIGSMYPYRLKLVEELLEFKPVLWGRGWGKADSKKIHKLYRGRDIRGTMKTKAICATSVSLNPHHPLNDIHGVNRRTYDISACKGFQIADLKDDMGDLYRVGEEIVCFRSVEELKKLMDYYLRHPDERNDIAEAAHRRTLKEHTYDHRAGQILEMIKAGAR